MTRFASRRRGAYTLVELLVVLTIMVILIASALAVARKVMEDTRGREASRQLNTWLTIARTRATATGRPCGLFMELDNPLGEAAPANPPPSPTPAPVIRQATRFYLAEVPPTYAGATTSSRGRIWDEDGDGIFEFSILTYNGTAYATDYTLEMPTLLTLIDAGAVGPPVKPGEAFLVRFDYKGAWFWCQRGPATRHPLYQSNPTNYQQLDKLYFLGFAAGNVNVAVPGTGQSNIPGYPFQILRQPRRVGKPLEMTGGSAVDLTFSGMGPDGAQANTASATLAVMFLSGGSVESVWADGLQAPPSGTIHFLIGRADRVANPQESDPEHPTGVRMFNPAKSNLADPNSLWVSIGRNGTVTTSDNFVPPIDETSVSATGITVFPAEAAVPAGRKQTLNPVSSYSTFTADQLVYLRHCRELATGRDVKGGR